jgi:hypothetical protein
LTQDLAKADRLKDLLNHFLLIILIQMLAVGVLNSVTRVDTFLMMDRAMVEINTSNDNLYFKSQMRSMRN